MGLDPRLVVPYVTEQSPRGERTMDIYSRLLKDRIVFLGTPVDDQVANVIMAQLLHLDAEDPEQDIHLYINSPGGSGSAMLAMYDTMQFVSADVATTALGMAASAGAFLLAAGARGARCPTRASSYTSRPYRVSAGRPPTWRSTPGRSCSRSSA